MLNTLKLFLPAVIPSWRFFDTIAPSPRIEFAVLNTAQDTPESWQEFRPKSLHLPFSSMLKRMVWNPRWNETLFLLSCAERLLENPTEHSSREIVTRIKIQYKQAGIVLPYLQFRLVLVSRHGAALHKQVAFISVLYDSSGNAVS